MSHSSFSLSPDRDALGTMVIMISNGTWFLGDAAEHLYHFAPSTVQCWIKKFFTPCNISGS